MPFWDFFRKDKSHNSPIGPTISAFETAARRAFHLNKVNKDGVSSGHSLQTTSATLLNVCVTKLRNLNIEFRKNHNAKVIDYQFDIYVLGTLAIVMAKEDAKFYPVSYEKLIHDYHQRNNALFIESIGKAIYEGKLPAIDDQSDFFTKSHAIDISYLPQRLFAKKGVFEKVVNSIFKPLGM